jgi:hypothetical protein
MGEAIAHEIGQTIAKKIAIGIALLIGFLFFVAFGGAVVLLLWNWLVPDLLNLRRVTYWEALGLLALSRILFGGFSMKSDAPRQRRRRDHQEWWKPSKPVGVPAIGNATPPPTA